MAAARQSSVLDMDKLIPLSQDMLSELPRSNPVHFFLLSALAKAKLWRYNELGEVRDLEMSILQFTHAIFLPFPLPTGSGPNLISAFFFLTEALFRRSLKFEQPSDVRCCIKYLHYLRDRSLEAFGIAYSDVTTFLVHALALQIKLEPSNATHRQGIEEMSALCSELLASDISEPNLNDPIANFSRAVLIHLLRGNEPSQQVIGCLRKANARLPELHDVSRSFSYSLFVRFNITKSKDDYEDAMVSLNKIVASHPPSDSPNEYVRDALGLSAALANGRFAFYGNPEYLEEAIFRLRTQLAKAPLEDPERRGTLGHLEYLERNRFDEFGVTSGSQEGHSRDSDLDDILSFSHFPDPQRRTIIQILENFERRRFNVGVTDREAQWRDSDAIDFLSFLHLPSSLSMSNNDEALLMTAEDRIRHIDVINSADHITDITEIERAIKYCQLSLASFRSDNLFFRSTAIKSCDLLLHAFNCTRRLEYLDKSIAAYRGILKIPRAQEIHFRAIRQLISCLFVRLLELKDLKDFDEIIQLFPIAATDAYAKVPKRFKISCQWAQFVRASRHPSASNAYESAISLMQDSLTFAPTLEMQHFRLVEMRNDYEKLPLDYASHQLDMGQLSQAIETLEQGRGLLWSEMRGFNLSLDQIRLVDPLLAEKFAAINQDLEALTTSTPPDLGITDDDGAEEMDPLGRIVVKQRKLLEERNGLIMQIRALQGFDTFLMAPSFDTLHSAAARGPVIIINHCKWRSDIIILLYNSPPSLILTPGNFYDRAKGLKDQLLAARKKGLDSNKYENALTSVLESLYDLVGRPVVERLSKLNVPEKSRIWWCPTSVFCSLPLHAMGPIRSDGPHKLYFSDLYIPSYTPTLTALIESRKSGLRLDGKPSLLVVAQPDESMPGSLEEIYLIQRRLKTKAKVTTLISKKATPSAVVKGLKDHRFAHFSCHGILDTGKPFNACFKLYEGERLTLLDIIRSRLPSAEFAFLAACHTAELTEESIADEGLHLTAAVQYSGFRSVVGTMWAMADVDGRALAKNFYGSVFSERWQDVPYYERTAEALRDAVKELRRKRRMSTERWVNFVHYGA